MLAKALTLCSVWFLKLATFPIALFFRLLLIITLPTPGKDNGSPDSCMLSYFMDDSGSWDLPKLKRHFDDAIVNDILEVSTDAVIDLQSRKHNIRVVLDELNQVKAGFSRPFVGSVPPVVAKAKAVLYAMGSNVHLPVDVLKTDCKTIVDKLKSCSWNSSPLNDIIICFKNLLSFNPN
uniref:RNase H type-1 domain-containing protein n=1 Tax=Cannabis sativa TaxID=3483 RepID=A0A803P4W2_CANSA